MLPLEKLVELIVQHAHLVEPEVRRQIAEKQDELSGLVSPEGAAYIVARELGLNLLAEAKRNLKVASVVPGMRSVDLAARVTRIFPPREFEKNGKKGAVANVILADSTGSIRLPLWNDEIALLESAGIQEGDTVKLAGGFTKEDYQGRAELRVGRGELTKTEEQIELPERAPPVRGTAERKAIADLKEEGFAEVRAALVAVAQRNPFYEVCPTCGSRLEKGPDAAGPGQGPGFACKEHGPQKPEFRLRLAGTLDDGTGSIRCVFFREAAEQLFGRDTAALRSQAQEAADALSVYQELPALGKEFIVSGRVKRGLNEGLEIVANAVTAVDAASEARKLLSA